MVKAFPAKLSEIGGKMENAKRKALHYYRALQRPVFSEDSGLYIQGLPKEEQPGVFVRRVGGRDAHRRGWGGSPALFSGGAGSPWQKGEK